MTSGLATFADALHSGAAHPDIPPEQRIFEPYLGSWDLVVTWYDDTGAISRQQRGEWHFTRVLEGRGIQDVWIVPPRAERAATDALYEYGTSLRFYDAALGAWRSTWIGPMHGLVRCFVARHVGNEVVLETTLEDGRRMRWAFSEIVADGFTWRNSRETEAGWILTQDFRATRARG